MSVKNIGSIGGITPYFDRINYRVKGWVSIDGIVPVLGSNNLIEKTMADCHELAKKNNATRISLRALTTKDLKVKNEEARIPISSELDLSYIGRNEVSRTNSQRVIQEERRILENLLSTTKLSEDPIKRVAGYKIETSNDFSERDLTDIKKLFETAYERNGRIVMWYKPSQENIRKVLKNSVVTVARNGEKIISLTAAEKATIPTSIGEMDWYEMSDAATLEKEKRFGLVQACTFKNMEYIFSNHPSAVYGEARACNIGATKSLLRLGFKYAGFLPKHVKIGGSRNVNGIRGDIEDLNVLYKEVE